MRFVRQLAIILSISFVAELMEYLIPIPVAASIYGLILMLVGLTTKIIPLHKVEEAADFLVEIMPILFVPPTVGIMVSVEALQEMLVSLCVISVIYTILVMAVTGRVSQGIIRRSNAVIHQSAGDDTRETVRADKSATLQGFTASADDTEEEAWEEKEPDDMAEKTNGGIVRKKQGGSIQ